MLKNMLAIHIRLNESTGMYTVDRHIKGLIHSAKLANFKVYAKVKYEARNQAKGNDYFYYKFSAI